MVEDLVFTEIINTVGNINKKYLEDGTKVASAAVKRATGKTVKVKVEEFKGYLEGLNDRLDAAIVLGVNNYGLDEFDVRTKKKEDPENGIIARSKERFSYCNSNQVGLMLLDIDSGSDHGVWTDEEISVFLEKLEEMLKGCFLVEDKLCHWVKESASAGVAKNGERVGNGYHIYIPVRNPNEELINLIHNWAWLNGWRSHLIDKSGGTHIRTIIDAAVRGPERLVFESDCSAPVGDDSWELLVRECDYYPGGVVDSELAINRLEEETAGRYKTESSSYIRTLQASAEVIDQKKKYDKDQVQKLILKSIKPAAAKKIIKERRAGTLLASDYIIMDDLTEAKVGDILLDPGEWDGTVGIRPPLEPGYGTSKCKIFVNDDGSVMLNSFAHGGQTYRLKWDYECLMSWLGDASEEDVDDLGITYLANSVMSQSQKSRVTKIIAKAIGATKKDITDDAAEIERETKTGLIDDNVDVDGIMLEKDATHHEISQALLGSFVNGYVVFGSELYAFGKTIWQKQGNGRMLNKVASDYRDCTRCKKANDYTGIVKHTLVTAENRTKEWRGDYGIPCANNFWKVDVETGDVIQIDYSSALGARYKIGYEPDFEMETPYWDKVLGNITNKRCFQQVCGLAISGVLNSHLQMVGVFKGSGGTGKGTTNQVMSAMLPAGRIKSVSIAQMNMPERRGDLADCIVNFIPELRKDRTTKLNMEGFKMCTGGDLVSGRNLFKDQFYFKSGASQILNMNDWAAIDSFGSDIERRLASFIIEFKRNHAEADTSLLGQILNNELPGVLAWFINGIVDYFEEGGDHEHSMNLFRNWSKSVDSVTAFMEDRVRFGNGCKVRRSGLAEEYKKYCSECGLEMKGKSALFEDIENYAKVESLKDGEGIWVFKGIELKIN